MNQFSDDFHVIYTDVFKNDFLSKLDKIHQEIISKFPNNYLKIILQTSEELTNNTL